MSIYVTVNLMVSLLEFYPATLLCRLFWKQAALSRRRNAACLGCYALLAVLTALPAPKPISGLLVYVMIFVVSLRYETQWYWRLFFPPCVALLPAAAGVLQNCVAAAVMGTSISQLSASLQPDSPFFLSGRILALFMAVFLAKLLSVVLKPRTLKDSPHLSLLSLALPLGTCVIVFYFNQAMVYVEAWWTGCLILLIYLLLFAGNLFLVGVVERTAQIKRNEQERIAAQAELQRETEHYRRLILQRASVVQAMQDVQNQLAAGLGLLRDGRTQEACALLERAASGATLKESSRISGNLAIDAILDTKRPRMEALNIRFVPNITMPFACAVSHEDLAVVAGNLLDNAINACQAFPQPEARYIRFTVKQFREYLCFQTENAASFQEDAPKPSAYPLHGFGLENVRQAARKYSGNLTTRQDQNRFTATVLLHNQEGSNP